METISVLTHRAEDVAQLQELLSGTAWRLTRVFHLDEAAETLKEALIPILLIDRETAGDSWQATIKRLVNVRRGACIIMLSNVSDQYLWDEMVQQGGFDLLTRPFRKEQVLATLMFAYSHAKAPWPKAVS